MELLVGGNDDLAPRRLRYFNLVAFTTLTVFGIFLTMASVGLLDYKENINKFIIEHYNFIVIGVVFMMTTSAIVIIKLGSGTGESILKLGLFLINCALTSILLLKIPPPVLLSSLELTLYTLLFLYVLSLFIPRYVLEYLVPVQMRTYWNLVNLLLNLLHFMNLLLGHLVPVEMTTLDYIYLLTYTLCKNVSKFIALSYYSWLFVYHLNTLYFNIKSRRFDPIYTSCFMYVNIMFIFYVNTSFYV